MLGFAGAETIIDLAAWANALIGKEVLELPGYRVVRVIQFQVVDTQHGYDIAVLVKVKKIETDTDQLAAIKEADIIEIEQLTSIVGEPSSTEVPLPEG